MQFVFTIQIVRMKWSVSLKWLIRLDKTSKHREAHAHPSLGSVDMTRIWRYCVGGMALIFVNSHLIHWKPSDLRFETIWFETIGLTWSHLICFKKAQWVGFSNKKQCIDIHTKIIPLNRRLWPTRSVWWWLYHRPCPLPVFSCFNLLVSGCLPLCSRCVAPGQ